MNAQNNAGRQAAAALTNYVNGYCGPTDTESFVDTILREHRTLQQSTMRLIMATIKEWAKCKHYDLRNEATIELARHIVANLPKHDALPLI